MIAVDNEKITVSKYSNGAVTSIYAAQGAKSQFSDTYDTDATHVIKRIRNEQQLKRPYDAIVAKMAAKGKKQFSVRWTKVAGGYSGTFRNPKAVTMETKAQVYLKAGRTYTIKATVAKLKKGKS